MKITFNPIKRDLTLRERGLDFADAALVFAGRHVTAPDDRKDYGELRNITVGFLNRRMVVMVWTQRGDERRIISMRHAHAKEERHWQEEMDRPG